MKHFWKRAKKKISASLVAHVVERVLLRLILRTCQIETCGISAFTELAKEQPVFLLCWHNRLNLFAYAIEKWANKLKYAVVISKSGDGEMLQAIVERHANMKAIRVAHNARHQALRAILQSSAKEKRVIAITPDGPQGPRYQAKPGAAAAAQITGAHLIAVSWCATSYWQLKSWDRMLIPKPFSRIFFGLSKPMQLPRKLPLHKALREVDSFLCSWDQEVCKKISVDTRFWPA